MFGSSSVRSAPRVPAFVVGFALASGCAPASARPGPRPVSAVEASAPAEDDARASTPTAASEHVEAPGVLNPEAEALLRALVARMTIRTDADGEPVLPRRCTEGPVPCRERLAAFATLIEAAARRHDLDPYLLGALAIRESGLDPSVLGRRGEAGIVQLHPRGVGRDVRFVQDPAHREACQSRVAACQDEVLEHGARALAHMIESCGSLRRGLGAYASGRCSRGRTAARRVLAERDALRSLSE